MMLFDGFSAFPAEYITRDDDGDDDAHPAIEVIVSYHLLGMQCERHFDLRLVVTLDGAMVEVAEWHWEAQGDAPACVQPADLSELPLWAIRNIAEWTEEAGQRLGLDMGEWNSGGLMCSSPAIKSEATDKGEAALLAHLKKEGAVIRPIAKAYKHQSGEIVYDLLDGCYVHSGGDLSDLQYQFHCALGEMKYCRPLNPSILSAYGFAEIFDFEGWWAQYPCGLTVAFLGQHVWISVGRHAPQPIESLDAVVMRAMRDLSRDMDFLESQRAAPASDLEAYMRALAGLLCVR